MLKRLVVISYLSAGLAFGLAVMFTPDGALREHEETGRAEAPASAKQAMIAAEFSKWSATTVDRGVAMDWRGDKSTVLYVEHQTYARTQFGGSRPDTWKVWARTQSGNLYKVRMVDPEGDLRKQSYALPEYASQDELLEVLVRNGEFALIDELKLPRKDA